MENLQNLMREKGIEYKFQEYDSNVYLFKVGNEKKINIITMEENSSTFKIDRDLFFYIDNQKEMYAFLLINTAEDKTYYLEFLDKNNWLKTSFDRSDKESIFFGKIVLQHRVNIEEILLKILSRIK
ncbi:MAG: hypothetical protein K0R80_2446 [Clostridia bacterium]|jgi:hypothetical protein|nr:hypothetical protein [Clostridia bacterium]